MGRRKKAQKVVKKKRQAPLATVFKCLFCNHEASVTCKLNLNSMIGELVCRICDAKYETQINTLSDPIDVFSEWLDEANELQEEEQRRLQEGLPTRATGFVGDGADFVPEKPDDMGEDENADVIDNDDNADEIQKNNDQNNDADQSMQQRSSSPDRAAEENADLYDADDDL